MKLITNSVWALVALVATSTVAQVWIKLTPEVAAATSKSATQEEHLLYIRSRVDELYNMEIERAK